LQKAVQQTAGRPMKVSVTFGAPKVSAPAAAPKVKVGDEEVTERALAHPEVRRFTELFPDAQVRTVRNLKE